MIIESIYREKRSIAPLSVFFLLIAASLFWINPQQVTKQQIRSTSLVQKTISENNQVTTWFENSKGELTYASDLRYAKVITSRNEDGDLEEYFDEKGNPSMNSSGYYGVLRKRDEKGRIIQIIYLGKDLRPIQTVEQYTTIRRLYDNEGRVIQDSYFDENGVPVCSRYDGYAKKYEYYEEGKIKKITYLDAAGQPMNTGLGYSSIVFIYHNSLDNQNGKVEYEFYYDNNNRLVSADKGQYGVHKKYDADGNNDVIIYLDAEGKPAPTSEGYTVVKRTFYPNNYIETERFFDSEERPFAINGDYYGIRRSADGITYLDKNGKELFNFKQLIHHNSYLVILIALIVMIAVICSNKNIKVAILVIYLGGIVYFTLLNRAADYGNYLQIFRSYSQFFSDAEIRSEIIKNIWLFVPLGTILYSLWSYKTILIFPVVFSILIEFVQYFTGVGCCEPDDIISNGLGAVIGYSIGELLQKLLSGIMNYRKKGHENRLSS